MERREISFSYAVYSDKSLLPSNDRHLLQRAHEALRFAYAPYSKFNVGVAMQTVDLEIITGSNQENGAFPIGQCAERVALYRLVHELGRKPVITIAIVVENENQTNPATPCGSCRQILNEYRNAQEQPIRLLLGSAYGNEVFQIEDVRDLLPFAFDGSFLGQ